MSDLPYVLSDELRQKLRDIGWFEGRKLDKRQDIAEAREFGWEIFPLARAIIEELDGLGKLSNILFNINDVSTNWGYLDPNMHSFYVAVEQECAERIFPVGEEAGWSPIYVSERGLFVQFIDTKRHWKGSTPQESFEAIINQMHTYRE